MERVTGDWELVHYRGVPSSPTLLPLGEGRSGSLACWERAGVRANVRQLSKKIQLVSTNWRLPSRPAERVAQHCELDGDFAVLVFAAVVLDRPAAAVASLAQCVNTFGQLILGDLP